MSNKLKIGLIGLGWVGINRHIKAIERSTEAELVAVADRNPQRLQAAVAGRAWQSCVATDIQEIAWLDQVDAIDIATSPMGHARWIEGALKAGKHVITEKPFCLDAAEGEALVALARERGLTLAIVHNFQFASSCARLRRDIDEGRLGAIRSISAVQWGNPRRRLPAWYEELPLGLFFDESPHLLYLLRQFSPGPLVRRHIEVFGSTFGHRTPAAVEATYEARTAHGVVPVTLSCKFESSLSEWYLSVHGDHGVGIVDVFRDIYVRLPNDGQHGTAQVLRTSLSTLAQHAWGYLVNGPLHLSGRLLYGNDVVMDKFARAVRYGEPLPGMSADEALAVLRMQQEIVASADAAPRASRGQQASA